MGRTVNQYYCEDCGLVFYVRGVTKKEPECPCCKSENTTWEGSSLKLYLANKRTVAKK